MHLWDTPQGVRVLHPRVGLAVGLADLANPLEQFDL